MRQAACAIASVLVLGGCGAKCEPRILKIPMKCEVPTVERPVRAGGDNVMYLASLLRYVEVLEVALGKCR